MDAISLRKWSITIILVLLLGTMALFTQNAKGKGGPVDGRSAIPTKPPFAVDQSGRIIPESLPSSIGIAGPDGRVVQQIDREELLNLLGPPSGPPGQTGPEKSIGPKPDREILVEERVDGSKVSTITDHLLGEVTRTETSP